MSTQNLIASLKAQETNLDELINALEMQKEAIIKNNYSSLDEAIFNEQKILHNVENQESERIKNVKELAKELNIELKDTSLNSLLDRNDSSFKKENKELQQLRKSLKEKILYIRNINRQLKDVIDFSRDLIKETIVIVSGLKNRSLVNKRV